MPRDDSSSGRFRLRCLRKGSEVVISHVTVTAAKIHGDSAVVMSIANHSGHPISLISVTSSVANSNMIDYDVNMCQGNHEMTLIANILITGRRTQELGYKYQGAMLRQLKRSLVRGGVLFLSSSHGVISTRCTHRRSRRESSNPPNICSSV